VQLGVVEAYFRQPLSSLVSPQLTVIVATEGMTNEKSRPRRGCSLKRRIVPTMASRMARRPRSRWRLPYRISGRE